MSDSKDKTVSVHPKSRIKSQKKTKKSVPGTKQTEIPCSNDAGATNLTRPQEGLTDFESLNREVAYSKLFRSMIEECLVDEKIEREETLMDLHMTQLADRFQKTIDQLDKTNKRMKNISFVVEQKRLLDLKTQNNTQFFETTNKSNAETVPRDLVSTEQTDRDKITLKDVGFGYNHIIPGHKQLLDAVNDAIEGLDQIKKSSNLDLETVKQYEESQTSIEELTKDRFDLESLRSEFEATLPGLSQQVLKEASKMMAKTLELLNNDDGDEDGDD